nr:hypothetical protein [Arthrobacter sp. SDTb3-6]
MDGLGRPFSGPEGPGPAGDLGGLGGVREFDADIKTDALDGPLDLAAIGCVAGLVSGTDLHPRQGTELVTKFGLVGFYREHVPGAPGVQVFGMHTLRMEGVGGYDHVPQVLDAFQNGQEKRWSHWFLGHILPYQHRRGGVVNAGEQVDPCAAAVLGATDLLSINGDGRHRCHALSPGTGQPVQGVSVQALEDPGPGRCVRGADARGGELVPGSVGCPLGHLHQRGGPGQHRANHDDQQVRDAVPNTALLPRIPQPDQRCKDLSRVNLHRPGRGEFVNERGKVKRWHARTPGNMWD